jgi:tetratricopeptide (TPR) repeat protein
MRGVARIAALHGALWNSDPWYRWSWYVWPTAMALLIAGWICIDKPAGPTSSAASWVKPTAPVGTAVRDGNNQNWVQNQLTRCYSKSLELSQSMTSCSALINTPQVRGKQLAAAFTQRGFLQRESDPDRAMSDYDSALKAQPDFADALAGRAWIRMTRSDYEAALGDLNKAVELSPKLAAVRYYRGYAHQKLEHFSEALADLNEAQKLQPDNADIYLARGEVEQALESYDAALRDFDEFRKDARGLVSRGAVLETIGKPQEALAAFESAVALAPDNAYAISERDRLQAEQNGADPPGKGNDPPK